MDKRLQNLRQLMDDHNLDAVLVSSVPNIIYLTGFAEFHTEDRDGYILITQNDKYFITSALYIDAAKKQIKNGFDLILATREKRYSAIFKDLIKKNQINNLGVDMADLRAFEFENVSKMASNAKNFDLSELRIKKSPSEITTIKKACILGDKVYSNVLKRIKIKITEKELAYEIENFIKLNGAEPSFRTVVAFGENASLPHHLPTEKKLKKNTFVLMDFGVRQDNYCSDMTRTIFFGKTSAEQKRTYETVLEAQQKAINYIEKTLEKREKPISTKVDALARDYIKEKGYPPFNHSSHGIGLNVHENPRISRSTDPLENGMVFSIEPGIYLPGKYGIRIEDIFAISDNMLIRLTRSPKKLIEL